MASPSLVLSLLFLSFKLVHPNSLQSTIIISSDRLEYLTTLSIGTPPTDILAIIDTATSLVQAQYNPNTSSTYRESQCDSEPCSYLRNITCGNQQECQYGYPDRNGSYSDGILASETFSFSSTVTELSFGRSSESEGIGRLGLGPGPLSLVSQLGSREFSYCLVPVSQNRSTSVLYVGESAPVGYNLTSTPLSIDEAESLYSVVLENVRLGPLEMPGEEVRMVVDTGTPFTYLPQEMYSHLTEELADLLGLSYFQADKWGPLGMCYLSNQEFGFLDSEITFGFSGADMILRGKQIFLQVDENTSCFTMLPNSDPDDDVAVLGNLAQQDFYFGYDLVKKQLSFASTDCTKF